MLPRACHDLGAAPEFTKQYRECAAVTYTLLRNLHMSCAFASFALFVLRGVWRFSDSPHAQARWARIVPHAIDSVLLVTALMLAWRYAPYPMMHAFLTTKISGLLVYILLGMTAFRWGRSRRQRFAAWIAAQTVFLFIVGVAFSKSPSLGLLG